MTVTYGKFEMPQGILVDEASETATFARFIAEPFERGYGHTIGNTLRRIILSSLEAPAIIALRIEGVPHEYMAIDGIIEDMTNIVLNFKGALLRYQPGEGKYEARRVFHLSKQLEITATDLGKAGQYVVKLSDVLQHPLFEAVNPDLPLFTVTKPMKRQIDLRITLGRGYVASERHVITDKRVDEIVVDSAFSPVSLVNYWVENTRVGQDTDYDRLIFEVTTDGRVHPREALAFAAQIVTKQFQVFEEIEEKRLSFAEAEESSDSDLEQLLDKLCQRINEIELSVRSTNCLNGAQIDTIGELVLMPESEMLKFKNFGKKSLNEIKAKLSEMGLSLEMDLSRYGITPENVKGLVQEHIEKKRQQKEVVGR